MQDIDVELVVLGVECLKLRLFVLFVQNNCFGGGQVRGVQEETELLLVQLVDFIIVLESHVPDSVQESKEDVLGQHLLGGFEDEGDADVVVVLGLVLDDHHIGPRWLHHDPIQNQVPFAFVPDGPELILFLEDP